MAQFGKRFSSSAKQTTCFSNAASVHFLLGSWERMEGKQGAAGAGPQPHLPPQGPGSLPPVLPSPVESGGSLSFPNFS